MPPVRALRKVSLRSRTRSPTDRLRTIAARSSSLPVKGFAFILKFLGIYTPSFVNIRRAPNFAERGIQANTILRGNLDRIGREKIGVRRHSLSTAKIASRSSKRSDFLSFRRFATKERDAQHDILRVHCAVHTPLCQPHPKNYRRQCNFPRHRIKSFRRLGFASVFQGQPPQSQGENTKNRSCYKRDSYEHSRFRKASTCVRSRERPDEGEFEDLCLDPISPSVRARAGESHNDGFRAPGVAIGPRTRG